MSEVNLNFELVPIQANLLVTTNDITFTPSAINLSFYAGGFTAPGGNLNTVQYNAGGVMGGIDNVTSTGNSISFANVGNIKIAGGTSGQVLSTDGSGNLSFATIVTSPGGSNTQLQYNNNGSFAGMANVTYTSGNLNLGPSANVKITGGTTGQFIKTDGAGNLSFATVVTTPGGSNTQLQYNNNGVLGGMANVTFVSGNLNLGPVSNVKITGGTANYVLSTDGTGNLSWAISAGGSGNGVPNGSIYTMQYNAGAGQFYGSDNFTYTPSVGTVNIQQVAEKITVSSSPATGTVNFDAIGQSIIFQTANATGNFTLNFRGNSTTTFNSTIDIGRSFTCTFINKNGTVGYYANAFTIDGTSITPLWFAGSPVGGGSANSYDSYTFNILKTAASTYTLFATAAQYA